MSKPPDHSSHSTEVLLNEIKQLKAEVARLRAFEETSQASIPKRSFAADVFNSAVEGMWTIGTDGLIKSVNRAAIQMFGYRDENEMIGKHSHPLVHHSHPDGSEYKMEDCPIYKAFQKGIEVELEDEVLWRKDGSFFYADYRSVPIYRDNKIFGAVVTFSDNTAKKKAIQELKLNQAWQAATLKGIGDAVITTDANNPPKVTFLNPVAEKLCGWTNEMAKGLPVKEVFHIVNQDTRTLALNPIDRVLAEGIVVNLEKRTILISKDAQEYLIEDSAAPIKSDEGATMGVVLVFRDVTEQRLAEQNAANTQAEMVNALESTSDAFFSLNSDLVITAVNAQHAKISGVLKENQIGRKYSDVFKAQASDSKHIEELTRSIQENRATRFEHYFAPLKIWVSVNTYPKADGGIAVFYRDISQEKTTRQLIEQHQKWLELVIQEIPVPIYMADPKTGKYSFGNKAMERMLGDQFPVGQDRSVQQRQMVALDSTTGERISFDDYPSTRALRGEEVKDFKFIWRTLEKDYHVSVTATTIPEIYGNHSTVMLAVTDETKQVNAQRMLEQSTLSLSNEKSKLDALIAESPYAIGLMRGKELTFEIANSRWRELVGSEREYLGKTYAEVYPEFVGTPAMASIIHTFESGETFTAIDMKIMIRMQDGQEEYRYFDYTNVRIDDSQGNPYGVFCYAVNVTERVESRLKRDEDRKELASTVLSLEKERELRERFVLALTHDLRTPLTALKMSAQLLHRKSDDPAFIKTLSKRIAGSVDRSDRMIRDLLDANRIKGGEGFPIQVRSGDLVEILQETLSDLNEIYTDRFHARFEKNIVLGSFDQDAVQRIVENLGTNAIKYGRKDAPVTVGLSEKREWVEISVHNRGNPISSQDQKDIFQQFTRSHSAIIGGQIGWGVGLTLVKGITEAHGGTIRVESSEMEGTTFFVSLPKSLREQK